MAVAMGLHIYYNVYYNVYWDESSSVTKPYDWSKNQSGQKSETRPVTYVEIFDKKCILEGVSRLAEYSIWNLDSFFMFYLIHVPRKRKIILFWKK